VHAQQIKEGRTRHGGVLFLFRSVSTCCKERENGENSVSGPTILDDGSKDMLIS